MGNRYRRGYFLNKELFVKRVVDTSKINGHFMDDYTAGLLYDNFLDMESPELEDILQRIQKKGEKVTYKNIDDYRKKKKEKIEEETPLEIVYECSEDCKICVKKCTCVPMAVICSQYMKRILDGDIKVSQAMKELHERYPTVGFDKKIGTPAGVIWDEKNGYITLYKYDEV